MFDFEDKDFIKKVIDSRDHGSYIIPLYVKIYNTTYSILELDTITSFNPSAFKVGFGTSVGVGTPYSFPTSRIIEYDFNLIFNDVDPDTGVECKYMIFESNVSDNTHALDEEINAYVNMLSEHVQDIVTKYKSSLLNNDDM